MLQKQCFMASHGCPPGVILQQELAMVGSVMKVCQPLLPSPLPKLEIIRFQSPSLGPNPCEESKRSQNKWCSSNQFVYVDFSALRSMLIDVQATCPNAVLFSFGIVEQCTMPDEILQFIMPGTAEAGMTGVQISLSTNLMDLQSAGIDEPQQLLPPLICPNSKFNIQKPLPNYIQDSDLSSKITVHPDGQVTFMGTGIEIKDLLALVSEPCLSEKSHNGEKQLMLVPHFNRPNNNEAEARSHSSTLKIHSALTVPLKSPEKVKVKPSQKKNKKVARERDLHKKNYLHACESLLSLMVDRRQRQKTAILSLKKSSPELPKLLTEFSAGIAGTGLAVLLSVICRLACGRVAICASKLFNTGFGFGLVWLSYAVNKLRDTIISMSKNAGRFGLKDEEIIQKLDKSIRDIYFRSAALLAMAVLRLA